MDARTIIYQLGGPSAAARFFQCRPAAVSQWKRENKIPPARLLHVKAARPDWFEVENQLSDRREAERREADRRDVDKPIGQFDPELDEKAA